MRMKSRKTDWPVFLISGGSLLLFVIAVFLNKSYIGESLIAVLQLQLNILVPSGKFY